MKSFLHAREHKRMSRLDGDAPDVVTGHVEADDAACTGCRLCVTICPGKALTLVAERTVRMVGGSASPCIGCGDCVAICEPRALTLTRPLSVRGGFFQSIHRGDCEPPRRF